MANKIKGKLSSSSLEWARGFAHRGVDVFEAYMAVEEIRDEHGEVTADLIYEAAKDPENVLNPIVFDCDTKEAAEHHYRGNAGKVVQAFRIKIVKLDDPEEPIVARAFHFVRVPKENEDDDTPAKSYETTGTVLANDDLEKQVLKNALADLKKWRSRYSMLTALTEVDRAIRQQILKLETKVKRGQIKSIK